MTNQQWLAGAQSNFVHIEKELGIVPDWGRCPMGSITPVARFRTQAAWEQTV